MWLPLTVEGHKGQEWCRADKTVPCHQILSDYLHKDFHRSIVCPCDKRFKAYGLIAFGRVKEVDRVGRCGNNRQPGMSHCRYGRDIIDVSHYFSAENSPQVVRVRRKDYF